MALQSFIPLSESKKTTEKQVKQRPSLDQLTKVESPGRPTPAYDLEDNKPTKRRIRRKETKEPTRISNPIKDSVLIITEKPQSAQKIAYALSPTTPSKKSFPNRTSYFEFKKDNKSIIVASAVGHLFNLTYSKGQKGWPIFNTEWVPSHLKKSGAFTKKYLELLKVLARRAENVIIATDYDIEGEVIGWNVLRFVCNKDTAKRMKYSTLTKNELQDSYSNLLSEPDWGQAYAGETRHILDWLYGINLSRALMSAIKTQNTFKILSIGRVQGPALKIIVNREREISDFKPEPFWQALAKVQGHQFKHPKDIFDKKELEKFKDIKEGIAETKETEENILPPHPFDLTTLQREAYRLNRTSPSQTLSIAQKLYLDGLISYPRTSSQKIPETINPKSILKALSKFFPQVSQATRSAPIEGKKTDPAHPSIFPTGESPTNLKEQEKKLFDIIAKRFISAFSPDAITENKRVKIADKNNPEITFTASGLKIKEKGWTKIYPATLEEKDCPTLNGPVNIDELTFPEKETQPPKRFTPTSLVTILEKKNLGTKATRSMIVDTLFNRGYLDGKSIKATQLGIRLIESLEKHSPIIIDENLTRSLEEEMEKFRTIKSNHLEKENEIINKAKNIITDISKEFKAQETNIGKDIVKGLEDFREQERIDNTLLPCPTCKKGNLQIKYSRKTKSSFVGCSNYPECTQTYNLPPQSFIKKSGKPCPKCTFPLILSIKKGKRPWELCFNPLCPDNKKRREDWEARKKLKDEKEHKKV